LAWAIPNKSLFHRTGQSEAGLEHYGVMRDTTDMLVNAILRLRRLLKQRQSAEDPASSGALQSMASKHTDPITRVVPTVEVLPVISR